ncbi:MAG TPA: hypothetical protein VGL86_30470 [Polyangia bacterium]|jgi:hypothetical protein
MDSTQILRRVGNALLVFCAFHVAGVVADFFTRSGHSISIDLTALVLGLLLRNGSLGAARWVAFIFGMQLVAVVAAIVVALPLALWLARDQLSGLGVAAAVWSVVEVVGEGVFAWWVLRELGDPAVEAALAASRRGSIRRASRWGGGVGAGCVAIGGAVGIMFYVMWPRWTAPVLTTANAQLGPGWQIAVQSMYRSPSGWKAHVVARRGGEVKELDLAGE